MGPTPRREVGIRKGTPERGRCGRWNWECGSRNKERNAGEEETDDHGRPMTGRMSV